MRRFSTAVILFFSLAGLGLSVGAEAAPVDRRPHVEDLSFPEASGQRVMKLSILIAASREAAWKAFTTTEGQRAWLAPVVDVDLRLGGRMEASYDPKAKIGDTTTIRQEILAYLPEQMIAFHNVQAPPGFAHDDLFHQVVTVLMFEDAGVGRVRVTCAEVGYGNGKDWDQLYDFFRAGNAFVLEKMKAHLESGPPPAGPAH